MAACSTGRSSPSAARTAEGRIRPTPLTSMLLNGCLKSGKCSTAGGATYNFSGIQCVGPADTGDALYAIEKAVFIDQKLTLAELVDQLKQDFSDPNWCNYFRNLNKFGNNIEHVDRYTVYVSETFQKFLEKRKNTRGGYYTTGLYSVTAHQYFGEITGALPSGRKKGEPACLPPPLRPGIRILGLFQ